MRRGQMRRAFVADLADARSFAESCLRGGTVVVRQPVTMMTPEEGRELLRAIQEACS